MEAILILIIIAIVLIISICKTKTNQRKEREHQEKIAREEREHQEKIAREERERQEIIAREKREKENVENQRLQEIKKYSQTYLEKEVTLEIANCIADFFVGNIKGYDRKTTEPNINIKFYIARDGQVIHADNENVWHGGMLEYAEFKYSLIEHHLKEIQDDVEFHSFLFALTQKTAEIINGKLLKDPSGTSYNLKITENIFTSHDGLCIYDGYHLSYTAKNGNYITPKDW